MSNNQANVSLESGLPSVGSIVCIRFCRVFLLLNDFVFVKVWAAGRNRAQQAISLYANLDYLRPYFDVEPKEVVQRYVKIDILLLNNSFLLRLV